MTTRPSGWLLLAQLQLAGWRIHLQPNLLDDGIVIHGWHPDLPDVHEAEPGIDVASAAPAFLARCNAHSRLPHSGRP